MSTTLSLALDWTPNINHIGFFVAKDLGFYEKNGIYLNILNPLDDAYATTPGKKLELGIADFAIAPFETVISLNNKANVVDAIAVFAILQEDLSSIATLAQSGIRSPKDLDGKNYASYKARYEDYIVKQMIKNDKGSGDIIISYPDKLGIWNTLLEGKADATWIFDNWEGVAAQGSNIQLVNFRMNDFGIPYGYSPVVLARKQQMKQHSKDYHLFIKATMQGFLYAKQFPKQAIDVLKKYLTPYDLQHIDLEKSLAITAPHFGDEQTCGRMKPERVNDFLQWLVSHQLEDKIILGQDLYTNKLCVDEAVM